MAWAVHVHIASHKLAVVLIGGDHVGLKTMLLCHTGERAYDIVRLKTVLYEYWNVVRLYDILDDWHRLAYILRRGFTLGFVLFKSLMAECGA